MWFVEKPVCCGHGGLERCCATERLTLVIQGVTVVSVICLVLLVAAVVWSG